MRIKISFIRYSKWRKIRANKLLKGNQYILPFGIEFWTHHFWFSLPIQVVLHDVDQCYMILTCLHNKSSQTSKGKSTYTTHCRKIWTHQYWVLLPINIVTKCWSILHNTVLLQVVGETHITTYERSGPVYINVTSTVPPRLFYDKAHQNNQCNVTVFAELVKGKLWSLLQDYDIWNNHG